MARCARKNLRSAMDVDVQVRELRDDFLIHAGPR